MCAKLIDRDGEQREDGKANPAERAAEQGAVLPAAEPAGLEPGADQAEWPAARVLCLMPYGAQEACTPPGRPDRRAVGADLVERGEEPPSGTDAEIAYCGWIFSDEQVAGLPPSDSPEGQLILARRKRRRSQ